MKKFLLIVDDEPAICLILETYFEADYEVVTRQNGSAALEWLATAEDKPLAAIVADYTMPVMDGAAFIQQVRLGGSSQHVPLIMLSGKESSAVKIECLKLGADDYLVKPFNPEELALRIQNLLSRVKI